MNLNINKIENEMEVFSLSITKNCETLIKKTYTRPEESLQFRLNKSRELFHFNPPIQIEW